MSRHGQCRCGVMLTFRKRRGYKARCPGCGKVVRLQPDGPVTGAVASAEIPEASETFEGDPDAKMLAVEVEETAAGGTEEVAPALVGPPAAEPAWTWQWLAIAGGLVAWLVFLSLLSWWWWQ